MAIQQTTPSAVRSVADWNYLNSSLLPEGILKPQVDNQLVRRYGTQSLMGLMEELGYVESVNSKKFTHYEEDFIHEVIKVDSSAAAAANAVKTLEVQSDYEFDINENNDPYVATGTTVVGTPRKYDLIEFEDGTTAIVTDTWMTSGTSLTQGQFNCAPTVAGENIPAVTTSSVIINTGRAVPEGGTQPEGVQTRLLSYQNNTMNLNDSYTVQDGAAGSISWLDNLGANENESYWYLEGIENTKTRFYNFCELISMTGKKITNTTLANLPGFEKVSVTEGFIPFLENYANVENYTAGGFSLTDLDNMIDELNKYKGADENALIVGLPLSRSIDNFLRTSPGFTDGGIIYNAVGGEEKAVNFGFKSFTRDNYTFHKKRYDVFTDIKTLGASDNFKYKNLGIVAPLGMVSAPDPEGATTQVPSFSIAYNDMNGMEPMGYKEWVTGSLGSVSTNEVDEMKVNFRKRFAFHGRGANRFGLFKAS